MTEQSGRHSAGPPRPDDAGVDGSVDTGPADTGSVDAMYGRPDGVDSTFAPREVPPPYTPPPATVSPQEREIFQRPAGAGEFAPLAGERLSPRSMHNPPIPHMVATAFGATEDAVDGFNPAPGTRIEPSGPEPTSPWWKADAHRDPWRDPVSPFWLGRGAVFAGGRPSQLAPDEDEEQDDIDPPVDEEPEAETSTGSAKRARFGLNAVLLTVVVALIAGGLGGGVGYWLTHKADSVLHRSNVSIAQLDKPVTRPPTSVAGIAKRVGPAVVSIEVTTSSGYDIGSGVVIDKNGYILTNNHVVVDATTQKGSTIVVTFSNEDTTKAKIVGRDPVSDLAVLKVPTDNLTVATLGNSDALAVGDAVIAIGSPLGLQGTVTSGIVSSLNRPVHVFSDDGSSDAYLDAIQTDAAINPGNSGGALVDAAGAVIGINSAGRSSTGDGSGQTTPVSGIGYAIPINAARDVAEQLIKTGKAVHASLGAQGKTAVAGLQEGAYLEQVVPTGAAGKAGLKNGDVVVAADGHTIISIDQLVVIVQEHKPGDKISVTYFRGAAKKTATLTLGSA